MRHAFLAPLVVAVCAGCSGASGTGAPASATAVAPASATSTSPPTAQAAAGFADLVRAGKDASFKIAYRYAATTAGQAVTVDQTWYVRGSSMRWDLQSPLSGSSSFFFLADGTYLCVSEGQPSCLKLAAAQGAQQNFGALFAEEVRAEPDRFEGTPQGTGTIAGIEARCFAVNDRSARGDDLPATACYGPLGLPLLVQFKGFSMEATSVSATVTDADFKLPGPVRTV